MKRSDINRAIRQAKAMMDAHGFHLPPFAHYPPQRWRQLSGDEKAILDARLGWDVTDFGLGDFTRCGLTLVTLRNHRDAYAEKIMIVGDRQITPLHYHWRKQEDIINRGGGTLVVELYCRNDASDLLDGEKPVEVQVDGKRMTLPPGATVRLAPGASITLPPLLYHSFWAEDGAVLAGEVSLCNDDLNDNRFLEPLGRFAHIEEDEAPLHLLCSDAYSDPSEKPDKQSME